MNRNDLDFNTLITIKGTNQCLGSLMYFQGHGTFDPEHGAVPVTKKEADIHNRALDQAMIEGLDKCQVGQCGMFYYDGRVVHTFTNLTVNVDQWNSDNVFTRKGKRFRIYRRKDCDLVTVKRTA